MADHLAFVTSSMGLSKIEVFRAVLGDERRALDAVTALRAIGRRIRRRRSGRCPSRAPRRPCDGCAGDAVRICLTTGFSADTQALIVDALGWRDLVDLALAPGPGTRGRPHPDLVLRAVLALEIDDVAAVACVGDTTSDLLCGWRAGAGVVAGVLTGAHDAGRARDRTAHAPARLGRRPAGRRARLMPGRSGDRCLNRCSRVGRRGRLGSGA